MEWGIAVKKLKQNRAVSYLLLVLIYTLAVIAAAPYALGLAAGAIANTALFLSVSIPLAEGRQSRKAGYALYKRQTRMLLPFRKRGSLPSDDSCEREG